jgi:hypothetical protein
MVIISWKNLAKYSFKIEIKQKFKIILLYVWLYNENQIYKYDDDNGWMMMILLLLILLLLLLYFPHFWRKKTSQIIV